MSPRTIRFDASAQHDFARLSGDFNPIHVDQAAARRMAAGEPIVHGMHVVLRALNEHPVATPSTNVSARFERPIVAGDTVHMVRRGATMALTLDGTWPLATVTVKSARRGRTAAQPQDIDRVQSSRASVRPRVRTLADIDGASGVVDIPPAAAIARRFPRAARAIGPNGVAALAAISRLIGMECPGRDSMLSALSLRVDRGDATRHLRWRVTRCDSRFGLVRIEVDGGGVHGTVDAFRRPAPVPPAPDASIASAVTPREFAGHRALIIGGSRGLGATTARLIAAGGGAALATFASGRSEAAALKRAAARAGDQIAVMRFDVLRDAPTRLTRACKRFRPTHLYYFATPRIFGRRRDPFDTARFRSFSDIYVTGFVAACRAAVTAGKSLHVFYPSSTSLDGTVVAELTEYAAAKAAGETVCASLNASVPGLTITVRRLPRVATDQTATILPVHAADPIEVMLPIVRHLHRETLARQ